MRKGTWTKEINGIFLINDKTSECFHISEACVAQRTQKKVEGKRACSFCTKCDLWSGTDYLLDADPDGDW